MAYSPTFQSVCESRPRQQFVPWSRYWCIERIQSRKAKYINASNCVVEVKAQFLVLLVAYGSRSGRRYPTQDVRQSLITHAKMRLHGISQKPKLAKALLRLV